MTELHSGRVTGDTCRDFLYFRQLVARSRGYWDDNINHRLNGIDTNDAKQCKRLMDSLDAAHRDRKTKIEFCISFLQKEHESSSNPVLAKEVCIFSLLDCRLGYYSRNL